MKTDKLLFGAAYYDEYLPYDRIETDMALMEKAHINVIRIAESTWSTGNRKRASLILHTSIECCAPPQPTGSQ